MLNVKKSLKIKQTDKKLEAFRSLQSVDIPTNGWINTIRTSLKMSLRQLGKKINTSPQNIKQIEEREVSGNVSIYTLQEIANALDMKLVYGFISKHDSLEQMIEKRAREIATIIVVKTNPRPTTQEQMETQDRIIQTITEEIKHKMPRYLWD